VTEAKYPKVYLVYIDESGDSNLGIFSALAIPSDKWQNIFGIVKKFRKELNQNYGLYVTKELHAWKFVSGRGQIAPKLISKECRRLIFKSALNMVSTLPDVHLFNVVYCPEKILWGFERLLTRIDRTMKARKGIAIIICDEGKEQDLIRIRRKMGSYNPILSQYGRWENGKSTKNITIDRIIEDPFFKKSEQSYFIQLVDFCAYSLLCKEVPGEFPNRNYLKDTFSILSKITVKEANKNDPHGIIRVQ